MFPSFHLCLHVYIKLCIIYRHFCWNPEHIRHMVQFHSCTHHDISSLNNSTWVPCKIKNTPYMHKDMITCREFSTERVLSSNIHSNSSVVPITSIIVTFAQMRITPAFDYQSSLVTFSLQQFSHLWVGELPLLTLTVLKNRGQLFCSLSLDLELSDYFFQIVIS